MSQLNVGEMPKTVDEFLENQARSKRMQRLLRDLAFLEALKEPLARRCGLLKESLGFAALADAVANFGDEALRPQGESIASLYRRTEDDKNWLVGIGKSLARSGAFYVGMSRQNVKEEDMSRFSLFMPQGTYGYGIVEGLSVGRINPDSSGIYCLLRVQEMSIFEAGETDGSSVPWSPRRGDTVDLAVDVGLDNMHTLISAEESKVRKVALRQAENS